MHNYITVLATTVTYVLAGPVPVNFVCYSSSYSTVRSPTHNNYVCNSGECRVYHKVSVCVYRCQLIMITVTIATNACCYMRTPLRGRACVKFTTNYEPENHSMLKRYNFYAVAHSLAPP